MARSKGLASVASAGSERAESRAAAPAAVAAASRNSRRPIRPSLAVKVRSRRRRRLPRHVGVDEFVARPAGLGDGLADRVELHHLARLAELEPLREAGTVR